MIRASLDKGASAERMALVLKVDVGRIKSKLHLLDNIAPEVTTMLKDRIVASQVFSLLKKMKPMRQIEAVEMMISANRLTVNYAEMLLVTTRPDQLATPASVKRRDDIASEDILRMEREMERLHQDYQAVEESIGDTTLALVVAKGYIARLLRNENINSHMRRHHADLLESLVVTMEAITADSRALERE
jgi:RepB plasmid partitioning protein